MAAPERVAFLGLGIMGRPQAANVCRAGFDLTVWNRTPERAESFAEEHKGVEVAESPAEAARGADVVISMVPDVPEVEEVLFAAAGGMGEGSLAVDMSTIAPTASVSIGKRLADVGIHFLDAPVTDWQAKAGAGTL